eukprot:14823446-Alexandrium_andersonii.AAC.1
MASLCQFSRLAFRRQPTPTAAFFRQCQRQRPIAALRCAGARGTVAIRSARHFNSSSGAAVPTLRFVAEPLFMAVPCATAALASLSRALALAWHEARGGGAPRVANK